MKSCIRCHKKKELSEFYKHPQMGDGHLNKCKTCCKIQNKTLLKVKKLDGDWLKQERARCRKKTAKARKNGTAAQTSNAAKSAWRARNRKKALAHGRAASAVIAGKLKRPARCEGCNKKAKRLEKHHEDYSKPLAVKWLCPPCHGLTKRK